MGGSGGCMDVMSGASARAVLGTGALLRKCGIQARTWSLNGAFQVMRRMALGREVIEGFLEDPLRLFG